MGVARGRGGPAPRAWPATDPDIDDIDDIVTDSERTCEGDRLTRLVETRTSGGRTVTVSVTTMDYDCH
jgi:hypothetical protein